MKQTKELSVETLPEDMTKVKKVYISSPFMNSVVYDFTDDDIYFKIDHDTPSSPMGYLFVDTAGNIQAMVDNNFKYLTIDSPDGEFTEVTAEDNPDLVNEMDKFILDFMKQFAQRYSDEYTVDPSAIYAENKADAMKKYPILKLDPEKQPEEWLGELNNTFPDNCGVYGTKVPKIAGQK